MTTGRLEAFLARGATDETTAVATFSGNTPEAIALAQDLRAAVRSTVLGSDRSLQVHLGPSEIGEPCHRQVAGKLAGIAPTNHVSDPWPSWVGTACHAAAADMLERTDPARWFTERKVVPIDGHSGTADLYDARLFAVVDHKFLGKSTHDKVVRQGPGRRYFVQTLLYGLGYRRIGVRVDRVMLAAWPRTGSSVSGLYVWDHVLTPDDDALLAFIIGTELPYRKDLAALLRAGAITLRDVPIGEDKPECYFCPFYRPEAARDASVAGCPGP
jgi:hypothetical protein